MTRTRYDRLIKVREALVSAMGIIDGEINTQLNRRRNQSDNYERRKARGQCVAKASCKFNVVPGHTCCAYHLRKYAEAASRFRVGRK